MEDVIASFFIGAFSWLVVVGCVIGCLAHLYVKYYPKDGITLWKSKDYSAYTGPSVDDSYDHGYE